MLKLDSDLFVSLLHELQFLSGFLHVAMESDKSTLTITDGERTTFDRLIKLLAEMDLPVSLARAKRDRERLEGVEKVNAREAQRTYEELASRIKDEIAARCLLLLTHDEATLYGDTQPFGAEVATKLPGAIDDLDEAAKCLALGRGTACVMHLMRAMEVALFAYANKLQATFKAADQWHIILGEIDRIITAMPNSTAADVKNKDEHRDAHACLSSVKSAWRHPSMHARASFTPERAKEIYNACRTFMNQLTKVV